LTDLTGNNLSTTDEKVDFSVVVPVYNSQKSLETLVRRIGEVFKSLDRSYEIVMTDDGSRDNSWQIIESLHSHGEPVMGFRLMKNHGQHYALKCGLDHCNGRYAITMDDDLQHPPEEIPKLIQAIESDPTVDVVIGEYERKKHSVFRNSRLQQAIFKKNPGLKLSSFRIINRAVIDEIRKVQHARPRIGFIILSITSRIKNVLVHHDVRAGGRSGYTLRKLISNTLDNVISYSSLPLRLISYIGILSSAGSMIVAIVFLVKYLMGRVGVAGFTTLILVILFTSGVLMFSFGLVGEYLIRIVSQQITFTQYTVRTKLLPNNKTNLEKINEGE
jgi:dolichol-phosphate mannosyltransferase/undecaprenyl-phosphate 4-deoxy-4-formamido-L-arabinose transferase